MPGCRTNMLYVPNSNKLNCIYNLDCYPNYESCDIYHMDSCMATNCNTCYNYDSCYSFLSCPCPPARRCCNPCQRRALPILTKCGLRCKNQSQNTLILVNNSCCPNYNSCYQKRYNKNYSFNDQLLRLKSKTFYSNCNCIKKKSDCKTCCY